MFFRDYRGGPFWLVFLFVSALIISFNVHHISVAKEQVTEVSAKIRQHYALNPFYRKILVSDGIVIVSSEKVSGFALQEAAYLANQMLVENRAARNAPAFRSTCLSQWKRTN